MKDLADEMTTVRSPDADIIASGPVVTAMIGLDTREPIQLTTSSDLNPQGRPAARWCCRPTSREQHGFLAGVRTHIRPCCGAKVCIRVRWMATIDRFIFYIHKYRDSNM